MKNITISVIISVILSGAVSLGISKWNKDKIGYVKSGVILRDYLGMVDANEQYMKEAEIVKTNIDTLANRYQQLKNEEKIISKDKMKDWEYRLSVAQSEYEKYAYQSNQQMQQRKEEITSKVLEKINLFIQDYGKENRYKFIFGTTNDGSILYGDDADDLTETMVKQLNDSYSRDANKPAHK